MERARARSGSPYEDRYGFSRAVRAGPWVHVSGTGPIGPDDSCPPDTHGQARRCFEIALAAAGELGATADDVIRTRMYIIDASDADVVGTVHAALLGRARPAATMVVVAGLVDPRWKVEIELEAWADRA